MTATEFKAFWEEFLEEIKVMDDKFTDIYASSLKWTLNIVGKANAKCSDSPLGDFILKKNGLLKYRKEDLGYDIAFAKDESLYKEFRKVSSKDGKEKINLEDEFQPIFYEILFEHENNIEDCWCEMIQLTYVKAKLKVLVIYNWKQRPDEDYAYIAENTYENFKTIINNSADSKFQEEYLLIIAQRDINNEIVWKYYIFE